MKKLITNTFIAFAVLTSNAYAVDGYDFDYKYSGNRAIAPQQVFDDGRQTIFQFAPGQAKPLIFIWKNNKWNHINPDVEGTYLYVPAITTSIKLKSGSQEAVIHYTGASERGPHASNARQNKLTQNSYADVAQGDSFVWVEPDRYEEQNVTFIKGTAKLTSTSLSKLRQLAQKLIFADKVTLVAYGNDGADLSLSQRRADAVLNALSELGIQRTNVRLQHQNTGSSDARSGEVGARIEYQTTKHFAERSEQYRGSHIDPTQPVLELPVLEPGIKRFAVKATDKNLLTTLQRWSAEEKWKLIPENFPHIELREVDQHMHTGTFLEALEVIKSDLVAKGYSKFNIKAYSNNVLRAGDLGND